MKRYSLAWSMVVGAALSFGVQASPMFKSGQSADEVRVTIESADADGKLQVIDISYAEASRKYPGEFTGARIPAPHRPAKVRMIDLEETLFGDDLLPPSCAALQLCGSQSTVPVTVTIVERAPYQGRCYTRTTTFILQQDRETWGHYDAMASAAGACTP
jgi:hypothetical protein